MADSKSKAASKKSGSSRSRSASRAGKTPEQNAATAGDNQSPRSTLVNELASDDRRQRSGDDSRDQQLLDPAVQKAILGNEGEPITSLNSLPKDKGGLPADEVAALRARQDAITGAAALGQPGQSGHGVGTATAGLQGPMSDEEIAANEKEYAKRTA